MEDNDKDKELYRRVFSAPPGLESVSFLASYILNIYRGLLIFQRNQKKINMKFPQRNTMIIITHKNLLIQDYQNQHGIQEKRFLRNSKI